MVSGKQAFVILPDSAQCQRSHPTGSQLKPPRSPTRGPVGLQPREVLWDRTGPGRTLRTNGKGEERGNLCTSRNTNMFGKTLLSSAIHQERSQLSRTEFKGRLRSLAGQELECLGQELEVYQTPQGSTSPRTGCSFLPQLAAPQHCWGIHPLLSPAPEGSRRTRPRMQAGIQMADSAPAIVPAWTAQAAAGHRNTGLFTEPWKTLRSYFVLKEQGCSKNTFWLKQSKVRDSISSI